MRINSTALLSRKMVVTRRFGAEAWNQIFSRMARAYPCLRSPLTVSSQVPCAEFLAFNKELVDRLFGGDERTTYFELGVQSAAWALVDGPYKDFLGTRDIAHVARSFPRIWQTYFTETTARAESKVTDDGVEFSVFGLPEWHPYFEYLVTGYMKGALELVCVNPIIATRIRGNESGNDFTYLLHTGARTLPGTVVETTADAHQHRVKLPGLSHREVEVLRLVAHGKTNKEIGSVLGISGRTVQIHISHIYDKIGAHNRASATMWFAEQSRRIH